MMKTWRQVALMGIALAASLSSSIVHAAANAETPSVTISTLRVGYPDGSALVYTTEPVVNPAGCPNGFAYWTYPTGHALYSKETVPALVGARLTERKVVMSIDGTACRNGYPAPYGVAF